MEGRGLIASWTPSSQTFEAWVSSQNPHEYHAHMAECSTFPTITCAAHGDIGGGFGQKVMVTRDEDCIVLASKVLGRPIKWIEDRRENLIAANQAREEVLDVSMALDDDARILACTVRHVEDVGAYAIGGHSSASGNLSNFFRARTGSRTTGFGSRSAYTNTVGRGAYRGPGCPRPRPRADDRSCGPRARPRSPGAAPPQHRDRRGASVHQRDRHGLRQHGARGLPRAGGRDGRLRRVPRRAGGARAEGRYLGIGISTYVEPRPSPGAASRQSAPCCGSTPGARFVC